MTRVTDIRRRVLLDTDIGGDIDDALCLSWLLTQPGCELMGITTVCGHPLNRARVASALCRVAGRDIPIRYGLDPRTPNGWYPAPEGEGRLPFWPHDADIPGGAVELLYHVLRGFPGQVDVLAIGSLTNLAALVARHPDAPRLARSLWAVAGVFDEALYQSPEMPYLNWNVWADPAAARRVLDAGFPEIRLFGVDVTRQLTLPEETVRARFTHPLLACSLDFGRAFLSGHAATLHDPLGAAAMFHPGLCGYKRGRVTVDTQTQGALHAVTRFAPDAAGPVQVACSVDRDAFFQSLFLNFERSAPFGQRSR